MPFGQQGLKVARPQLNLRSIGDENSHLSWNSQLLLGGMLLHYGKIIK
jgi:hypothetical protein